jgi:transposase
MGMAHIAKKVKKGKTYYYIRETARVDGKPRTVNQIYLGSIERILDMALGQQKPGLNKIQTQEFGSLFLASLIDKHINLVKIIDSVVPPSPREKGPTLGEYFLYAVFNRMIQPRSKMGLANWYKNFAVHQIRPVDTSALTSQRYWEKWDRVDQKSIQYISRAFFNKVSEIEKVESDCFLFDTTNYFHYMDSKTSSELAVRGHNKDGKHWLRQIGLALLVSRTDQIPLFYREFEGNCHDSKLFNRLLEEIFDVLNQLDHKNPELTIVVDKGMNSEDNLQAIDSKEGVHFITTYSVAFADDLARKDLSLFSPVDTPNNRELIQKNRSEDQMVAWRTSGRFWNQERTVVVTYNPRTAAKQRYSFDKKLGRLQNALFEMRSRVRAGKRHWTSKTQVMQRYQDLCGSLYLPQDLYDLEFKTINKKLHMYFRKNHYRISRHVARFGKNIIITSHHDWSTDQIVQASLDRYQVEHAFRQTKAGEFGNFRPTWHWTDSKLRCHLFSCVVALTYLSLIRLWLHRAGVKFTPDHAMQSMRNLSSCLCWQGDQRKPFRMIEEPDPDQARILKAFGYKVQSGVLQSLHQ